MRAFIFSAALTLPLLISQVGTQADGLVFASEKLIDLTHSFDAKTIYWPTEPGFKLEPESAGVTDKGYFYSANRFATAEHGGTHIDAPIHFFADRETVDQIPLWRLIGPAVCVDVSQRSRPGLFNLSRRPPSMGKRNWRATG